MSLDIPRFVALTKSFRATAGMHIGSVYRAGDSFIVLGESSVPGSLTIQGPSPDEIFEVPRKMLAEIKVCPWNIDSAVAV
jgi:hypothetical protein